MTRIIPRMALMAVLLVAMSTPAAWADQAGAALLDRLVTQFEQVARGGSAGPALQTSLGEMMTLARKARDEQQITPVFFERYTRMLRLFKLTTTSDPEQILKPVIEREIREFVKDVSGEKASDIGAFASAMARELDNLRASLNK